MTYPDTQTIPAVTLAGSEELSRGGIRLFVKLPADGSPITLRRLGYLSGLGDLSAQRAACELVREHLAVTPELPLGRAWNPASRLVLTPSGRAAQRVVTLSSESRG